MSAEPECKRCGLYVQYGPVLCAKCSLDIQGENILLREALKCASLVIDCDCWGDRLCSYHQSLRDLESYYNDVMVVEHDIVIRREIA